MGCRVGPVALRVHSFLPCKLSGLEQFCVRQESACPEQQSEFFRAQAPYDFRSECPPAFLYLKKCSELLMELAEISQWSRREWRGWPGVLSPHPGYVFGGNSLEESASLLNSLNATLLGSS